MRVCDGVLAQGSAMLRLPTNPLGPFWLEDLVYLAIDETRRLPARLRKTWTLIREHASGNARLDEFLATLSLKLDRRRKTIPSVTASPAARLEEPEEWALATEPVNAADIGTAKAAALHEAAAEQLDALTYVLARIREEVRPHMTYARFVDEPVHVLPEADQAQAALDALLELSRQNAATRPKRKKKKKRSAA